MRSKKAQSKVDIGVILSLVVIGVAVLIGIYIGGSFTSVTYTALEAQYSGTNTTDIILPVGTTSVENTSSVSFTSSLPADTDLASTGTLTLVITRTNTTGNSNFSIAVGTYELSPNSTEGTSYTNQTIPVANLDDTVTVTFTGYNATINSTALAIDADDVQYAWSTAQGQAVTNFQTSFNIASIVPIILIAAIVISALGYMLVRGRE